MIKLISVLTFALALGIVAYDLLSPPGTSAAVAPGKGCPLRQVALDEGYGVTRMELRPVYPNQ